MHGIRSRCEICPARNCGLCASLDNQALLALSKFTRHKTLKPHEVIFHEGDISNQYFSVIAGAIKLVKNLVDGHQHIIGLIYPPGFTGQSLNSHHTYSGEAATDLELCCYPREPFDMFVKAHPELEHKIFELTVRELDTCRDWMLLLGRKCSYERVAGFLLMMAGRLSESGDAAPNKNYAHFQLPFTRLEMADYLGLTLETVSRQFSLLKQEKIIALPSSRDVIVADLQLLGSIANIDSCSNSLWFDETRLSA